jgi:hypothetical protein
METTPASAPQPRRRRPHPARTTRRAVGAASVGATIVLAGGMAVTARHATTAAATSVSNTTQTTTATATEDTTESDDTSSASNLGSIATPAQSGVASSQAVTSTNAS